MAARTGRARVAAVIGHPVGHSLSPAVHEFWLAEHGIDGAYVPIDLAPEHFASGVRMLAEMGFAGCNVTIPHKEAAFALVDTRDATADAMGAVNTVTFREGKIHGANTDAYGFTENLLEHGALPRPGATALVIGAGGAARAVAAALAGAGCSILFMNRTPGRAEALAAAMQPLAAPSGSSFAVLPWKETADELASVSLVVNTTTLGMQNAALPPLRLEALPKTAVVTDIVYRPLRTPLLERADALGLAAVDGLGMLLHQAAPGFEAWFGVRPRVTTGLREHVVSVLKSS